MKKFLELNSHKLKFIFSRMTIICLLVTICLIGIRGLKELPNDLTSLFTILLIGGFGFPVFILTLTFLEWNYKLRIRNKAFSYPPFNQLEKIGFSKSIINKNSKWLFTEITKECCINNIQIICDVKKKSPNTILFTISTNLIFVDDFKLKSIKTKLEQENIEYNLYEFLKTYNIKSTPNNIEQLKLDLENFTSLITQINIKLNKST